MPLWSVAQDHPATVMQIVAAAATHMPAAAAAAVREFVLTVTGLPPPKIRKWTPRLGLAQKIRNLAASMKARPEAYTASMKAAVERQQLMNEAEANTKPSSEAQAGASMGTEPQGLAGQVERVVAQQQTLAQSHLKIEKGQAEMLLQLKAIQQALAQLAPAGPPPQSM